MDPTKTSENRKQINFYTILTSVADPGRFEVPGLFEPPVTVIMLSPGIVASLLSVSIGSQHIV